MYPPSSSFLLPVFQCAQSRTPKANMVHVTQWPASSFFLSFSSKKHAKYARGGWRREERKKVPGRLSEETGIVSCGLSECPVSPPTGGGLGSGGHGAQPGPAWELGLGSGVCWPGGGQGQPRVGWGLGGSEAGLPWGSPAFLPASPVGGQPRVGAAAAGVVALTLNTPGPLHGARPPQRVGAATAASSAAGFGPKDGLHGKFARIGATFRANHPFLLHRPHRPAGGRDGGEGSSGEAGRRGGRAALTLHHQGPRGPLRVGVALLPFGGRPGGLGAGRRGAFSGHRRGG